MSPNEQPPKSERQLWMATLAKASPPELNSRMQALGQLPDYRMLRSPEVGLTMVRGRAGSVGQVFNLGEMTLTRCVIQLETQTETITGYGYVGGRSHKHAEQAALCDGLLQHPDWHHRVRETIVIPLQVAAQARKIEQQQQTAATKVDFFTLRRGE